jgi:hypothetical protein
MTPASPPSKYVRCKLCGAILPGWHPLFNEPNGAMLLHHLGDMHRDVVGTYLDRMHGDDDIDRVAMEAFERMLEEAN